MRLAQKNMTGYLSYINWKGFRRRNLNQEIKVTSPSLAVFGCGDKSQAVVWLLRQDKLKGGMVIKGAEAINCTITIPGIEAGTYSIYYWDTTVGAEINRQEVVNNTDGSLTLVGVAIATDLAVAVVKK
jgi:mannan endo-1,4-beta-mannosidase